MVVSSSLLLPRGLPHCNPGGKESPRTVNPRQGVRGRRIPIRHNPATLLPPTMSLVFPHTFTCPGSGRSRLTCTPTAARPSSSPYRRGADRGGQVNLFVQDMAILHAMGIKLVLVHGFPPQVNEQLRAKGQVSQFSWLAGASPMVALELDAQEAAGQLRFEIEAAFSRACRTPRWPARRCASCRATSSPHGRWASSTGWTSSRAGWCAKVDAAAIRSAIDIRGDGAAFAVRLRPLAGLQPVDEDVAMSTAIALQDRQAAVLTEVPGIREIRTTRKARSTLNSRSPMPSDCSPRCQPDAATDPAFSPQHCVKACRGGVERFAHPAVRSGRRAADGLHARRHRHDGRRREAREPARRRPPTTSAASCNRIEPFEQDGTLVKRDRTEIERDIGHYTVIEHDGVIFGCAALYPILRRTRRRWRR